MKITCYMIEIKYRCHNRVLESLRVQDVVIDPESKGVLNEIKLGCYDGNFGEGTMQLLNKYA